MVRDFGQSVKLSLTLFAFFATFLLLSYPGKIILLGVLSFWTYKEYVTLISPKLSFHHAVFWCFLSIPLQYYFVATAWYGMFLVFIPIYMFLSIPLQLVFVEAEQDMLATVSKLHWGLMAFVFGLSHFGYFYNIKLQQFSEINGFIACLVGLTLATEALNWTIDKLSQLVLNVDSTLSVKITNVLLCSVTIAAASYLLRSFSPYSSTETWLVGAGIALVGLAGKNGMSEIRRDLGIDDADLIPGTGALLTSFDSLCYTIPIFFHVTYYFYGI